MIRKDFIEMLETNAKKDIDIVKMKNQDYATNTDPFSNFRVVESLGVCSAEKGILVRMSDKMARIGNLLTKEAAVKDESILDTLSDLRNYANILQCYLSDKNEQRRKN